MAADARRRMGEQEFEIYAEGNALRRVERVAEPREIERPAKKPINVQARKNRARAMELTALHAAVLLAATLVVGIFCCQLRKYGYCPRCSVRSFGKRSCRICGKHCCSV